MGPFKALRATMVLVAVLALAPTTAKAAVEVQRVVSPGGIEAWLVEEHRIPFLSMRFAFRGGAALDPEGKDGLAELVSGMLNEGAGDLDALAYQTAIEDNAIRLGFDAGLDEFAGTLETLTERRERAFELLAIALAAPHFSAEPLERVRAQLISGLVRETKNPNTVAQHIWHRAVFGDHPYARSPSGSIASVESLTADDLRGFADTRFTRDRLVLGVAGDIDAETLGRLLDETFGGLPETGAATEVADTVPGAVGEVLIERMPQPQSVVMWGQRGLKRDDPEYYAAYVMNHILGGGGFSSRLTEEVREKRGLAYGVYSYLAPRDHAALYLGGVATQNERVAESIEVIRAEFARMRDEGVSADELSDAKTYLTGSFPLRLDSNSEIASMLVGMQIAELGIDYLEHRQGLIESITLDDVRRVAASLIDPDSFTIVVVGDPAAIEPSAMTTE
jgi:zinc protease